MSGGDHMLETMRFAVCLRPIKSQYVGHQALRQGVATIDALGYLLSFGGQAQLLFAIDGHVAALGESSDHFVHRHRRNPDMLRHPGADDRQALPIEHIDRHQIILYGLRDFRL